MKARVRLRAAAVTAICALGALAVSAAPASAASTVTYNPSPFGSNFSVAGEANDDAVTISLADGLFTISDAGTGGITTADADCANVAAASPARSTPPTRHRRPTQTPR